MATHSETRAQPRIPLSRERVLRAAVDLADRNGIKSLTMRNLAHELGVEAMSLYYHVANKEELCSMAWSMLILDRDRRSTSVSQIGVPQRRLEARLMRHRILTARRGSCFVSSVGAWCVRDPHQR